MRAKIKGRLRKYDSTGSHSFEEQLENCYYEGTVNKSLTSFVAISTCNGLRGIINVGNGISYGIWPLEGGEQNRGRRPHLLYVTRWSREAVCGSNVPKSDHSLSKIQRKRDVTQQIKYFELAVIADHSYITDFNFSEKKAVDFLLEAINIADSVFFFNFNIRLSVVYSELWFDSQRVSADKDIERTLSEAVAYVTDPLYQIKKDVTVFLTRERFTNNETGSGTFGDACSSRATAIVTSFYVLTRFAFLIDVQQSFIKML
ncbi:unnamed protein product [Enterobius vermicularis]|uniref:Peptidase M12B domain-containing protein n=1 Tax=Enterobius vermicularis TaxID=51028 RepID=A0A0N4UXF9_ENTVE|nr:unnamed protein product [Enterobius vermicularis]